ncbi:MAG TPA: agmatine deiminase family protein [Candidatus Binatia bacterium]|nr:agmatine deiminase family protein [Candidatus Binatia bacterium]
MASSGPSGVTTPRELGYRWPAEWEPHAATWLAWPHKEASWPGKFEPVPAIFVEMVRALVPGERVEILVLSEEHRAPVARLLRAGGVDLARVGLHVLPTDDAWIRDHGPIFLRRDRRADGEGLDVAVTDWGYNAWGGKYPPWEQDDRVPTELASRFGWRVFEPGMILEGGSVDGDGEGTVLTTESCLLNPNRNPSLGRDAIEQRLRDFLCAEKVLWLGDGIAGDDTDGHVDDLARFVAPGVVVTVVEEDPADENYRALQDNLARLRAMVDARGRRVTVRTLPMPRALYEQGQRLPASYANFYVANSAVLVPAFDDPNDEKALAALSSAFPGRRVIGIRATDLVWGLGAFHCLTQQQPA